MIPTGANTSLVLNGVLSVNGYLLGATAAVYLEDEWEAKILGAITIMCSYSIVRVLVELKIQTRRDGFIYNS
jgi:hypothetical protein